MALGFSKYSKKSHETQVWCTLKNIIYKVLISRGIQNGCAFSVWSFLTIVISIDCKTGKIMCLVVSLSPSICKCLALPSTATTDPWKTSPERFTVAVNELYIYLGFYRKHSSACERLQGCCDRIMTCEFLPHSPVCHIDDKLRILAMYEYKTKLRNMCTYCWMAH